MLDPWIIEEILKKEEERRRESEQVRIELPIDRYHEQPRPSVTPQRDENQRGVVVIDI